MFSHGVYTLVQFDISGYMYQSVLRVAGEEVRDTYLPITSSSVYTTWLSAIRGCSSAIISHLLTTCASPRRGAPSTQWTADREIVPPIAVTRSGTCTRNSMKTSTLYVARRRRLQLECAECCSVWVGRAQREGG